mmetsp:Transcript_19560/g.29618  ORF Transcript_19560/g.29618 Transcript_19560/m.29618 type:complete len:90 (-) Transcript_19560:766-1035(-)
MQNIPNWPSKVPEVNVLLAEVKRLTENMTFPSFLLFFRVIKFGSDAKHFTGFFAIHASFLGQIRFTLEDIIRPTIGCICDKLKLLLQIC